MTRERFEEIYHDVVVNAFYDVGNDGSISHEEMVELIKMAELGRRKGEIK